MPFTDTIVFIGERVNISKKHKNRIQNKKIWKSLRNHIMSRRKKNKQAEILAEINADILRKKKTLENQQIEEHKLSIAQINGRLSELHIKRNELQQEKQALLSQTQIIDEMNFTVQRTGLKWNQFDYTSKPINNTKNDIISATALLQQQLTLLDLVTSRTSTLIGDFNQIKQCPVIIPAKINSDKQQFWIIHPPP